MRRPFFFNVYSKNDMTNIGAKLDLLCNYLESAPLEGIPRLHA